MLGYLQASLDMKIELYDDMVVAASRHHGINDLPSELLLKVLGYLSGSYHSISWDQDGCKGDEVDPRKLATVNHRFRDIIYNCPSLWSFVESNDVAPEKLPRLLARIGSAKYL